MTIKRAYIKLPLRWCVLFNLTRYLILSSVFFFIISSLQLSAQDDYSEISVFTEVPQLGGTDLPAVISGSDLYLPVTDLFDFLRIRNVPDKDMETISGFFINPETTYTISRKENKIVYQDKTYQLESGALIRTESNLYLKTSYLGTIFGLDCKFNFRSLSVKIYSSIELPMIREMRLEEMRKNLTRLKGEEVADTTIGRTYPLFKFGMADWSVMATEEVKGRSDARVNLALGGMIAGGEATAHLYANTRDPFDEKQQYYLWRYVNNDFSALRQVMAGKISTHSISSIYRPVVGVQITNTPTTYRRSFGSYTLSDRTEPNWIVELYVNNVLVDFVKADASGFFTFQVPLVYGNSNVRLKFFGPWGEERVREQNINIPFNFLPEKILEYTASAGVVEDSSLSRFSRVNFNYGLSKSLTVGGGVEYLSSVASNPAMPFLNASLRITNNLLLWGEYTHGVRAKGTLTYRLPSNLQFDVNYTWYDKDQKAISFNYREERKVMVSMPLRIGKFNSYQRMSVYQIILPNTKYTTGEWLFSGSVLGVNTNFTTNALFIDKTKPYLYSNISLGIRLPAGFVLTPQVQYGYNMNGLISARAGVEKHFFEHAYMNLTYEKNFASNINMAEAGFRYDFSFAQTGASVRQSDKKTTFIQYARGSLINDTKTKYLKADNRTNVGKGGITITAFLDVNSNGRRDDGESKVYGLNLHINGGRIEKNERDSTIRILGLEPYTNCFIELDPFSFENVAWRLSKLSMSVAVDPEILKNIEIPVMVVGEAVGNVYSEKGGIKNSLGRIIIGFFNENLKQVAKVLTEDDGSYTYFGLKPGRYTVRLDTAQLRKLDLVPDPESHQFSIKPSVEGDFVEGLDFILKMKQADTIEIGLPVAEKQLTRKDTSYMIIHEITRELVTIPEDCFAIQLGAFKNKGNAETLRTGLENLLGKKVEIIIEDDFYKVRIPDLKDRKSVDDILAILKNNGITEVWIINLKAKQKQWVLREQRDSIAQVTETVIEKPFIITSPKISIQIGAFRDEARALFLKNKISSSLKYDVVIVNQNGYYKVRITGFASIDEVKNYLPALNTINLHNNRIIPAKRLVISRPVLQEPEEAKPVTEQPVIEQPVIEQPVKEQPSIVQPVLVQTDTILKKEEEKIEQPVFEEQPVTPKPLSISLQVGVYYRKGQAYRAQRRITSKLKLHVEVVKQWDYYRVIVRGFHSREETYKYYPELAGIGYPGITLIEEK
jgi:cell division protein FtsN